SGARLPVPEYQVLEARQLLQAHGAAGVHFAGGDADFGAHAELAAVGELGGGVVHHHRAVDRGHEAAGGLGVLGQDRVGVVAGVRVDPGDALVEAVDDLHAGDGVEVLGVPVFLGRGLDPVVGRDRLGVAAQSAVGGHGFGELGDDFASNRAVDDDALGRAADAGAAELGVADDLHRLVDVGRRMDVA